MRERGNLKLHLLDRYIGIPAIAGLGWMKAKRPLPPLIQRIGLLKAGAIGDTVLMSAVIADLRSAFPDALIFFFAGGSNVQAARMLEGLDRVIDLPVSNVVAAVKAIRSVEVDVILDFGQWSRLEALLCLFSGARAGVGFKTAGQHRHGGYDYAVEHSSLVHEIENFRRLVRTLGVETSHLPFLRAPKRVLLPNPKYGVFQMWPGGTLKRLKEWPRERWLRLIEEFALWGVHVVLTGGPSDRTPNDELIGEVRPETLCMVTNVAGSSLEDTSSILSEARLVVTVDTGVMHIAAALGVPLIALHGPTSSKRWGPISQKAIVLESPLKGCGYVSLGWEHVSNPPACMECISYEAVRETCQRVLQGENTSRQDHLGLLARVPSQDRISRQVVRDH